MCTTSGGFPERSNRLTAPTAPTPPNAEHHSAFRRDDLRRPRTRAIHTSNPETGFVFRFGVRGVRGASRGNLWPPHAQAHGHGHGTATPNAHAHGTPPPNAHGHA